VVEGRCPGGQAFLPLVRRVAARGEEFPGHSQEVREQMLSLGACPEVVLGLGDLQVASATEGRGDVAIAVAYHEIVDGQGVGEELEAEGLFPVLPGVQGIEAIQAIAGRYESVSRPGSGIGEGDRGEASGDRGQEGSGGGGVRRGLEEGSRVDVTHLALVAEGGVGRLVRGVVEEGVLAGEQSCMGCLPSEGVGGIVEREARMGTDLAQVDGLLDAVQVLLNGSEGEEVGGLDALTLGGGGAVACDGVQGSLGVREEHGFGGGRDEGEGLVNGPLLRLGGGGIPWGWDIAERKDRRLALREGVMIDEDGAGAHAPVGEGPVSPEFDVFVPCREALRAKGR
jgi:hypothetical protein